MMSTLPKIFTKSGGNQPFIEAHRGAVNLAPENTMASFEKVLSDTKASFIEIDVQLSKDNEVVVIHDPTLERTTDGQGSVGDFTLEELKSFDAGSWFSNEFKGEKIPTLRETIQWAKDKIWLSIEVKNDARDTKILVEETVKIIQEEQAADYVQVISFNHRMLALVKKLAPEIMTSAITPCALVNPSAYLKRFDCNVLNGPGEYLTAELVEDLHYNDRWVNGGMCNDLELWDHLASLNVDLICTNIPEVITKERF